MPTLTVTDTQVVSYEDYSAESLRKLDMPVWAVYGSQTPDASHKVAGAVAALVSKGSLVRVDGASHALTTTHGEQVAELIATLARAAHEDQPEKV